MDREQKRAARIELMADLLGGLVMGEFMSLKKLRKALRDSGLGNHTENQLWDAVSDANKRMRGRGALTPAYRGSDVTAVEKRYQGFDEAYVMMQGSIDLAHWGKLEGLVRVPSRAETPFMGV